VLKELLGTEEEGDLPLGVLEVAEPWITFSSMVVAKSPRMVPGRASLGWVAPIILRTSATTPGPSRTMATTGPEVMKRTRPGKKGFSRCSA